MLLYTSVRETHIIVPYYERTCTEILFLTPCIGSVWKQSLGDAVEKLALSYIAGGNAKYRSHYEEIWQ